MKATLEILNELESGVLSRYAIGGAIGATFYVEPLLTFDLAVFAVFPRTSGGLVTLQPLYEALRARDFREDGECVHIAGVPVQFISSIQRIDRRGAEGSPADGLRRSARPGAARRAP